MKLIKVLDQKGVILVSDVLNQTILQKLVMSECSIAELSKKLNVPTLKLWRRMQKLIKANLVELSRTEKVGNLEKKLYRTTAANYVPQQLFEFKPKDANLQDAYEIYTTIQKEIMAKLWAFKEIPKEADPIDFVVYATMQAFVQVSGESSTQTKITELKQELSKFQEQRHIQS
jgi:beta-xylosidase